MHNGTIVVVKEIDTSVRRELVYNFTVANTHNYFVGENGVFVHNAKFPSGGCPALTNNDYHHDKVEERIRNQYSYWKKRARDISAETLGYTSKIPPNKAPFNYHNPCTPMEKIT